MFMFTELEGGAEKDVGERERGGGNQKGEIM